MNSLPLIVAQAEAPPPPSGGFGMFGMLAIMMLIFYFLMIRPQKRREKERKAMLGQVKAGNRVLLTSGIIGEIINVKESTLVIRIAENTKIEVVRAAISQVLEKDETPDDIEAK